MPKHLKLLKNCDFVQLQPDMGGNRSRQQLPDFLLCECHRRTIPCLPRLPVPGGGWRRLPLVWSQLGVSFTFPLWQLINIVHRVSASGMTFKTSDYVSRGRTSLELAEGWELFRVLGLSYPTATMQFPQTSCATHKMNSAQHLQTWALILG